MLLLSVLGLDQCSQYTTASRKRLPGWPLFAQSSWKAPVCCWHAAALLHRHLRLHELHLPGKIMWLLSLPEGCLWLWAFTNQMQIVISLCCFKVSDGEHVVHRSRLQVSPPLPRWHNIGQFTSKSTLNLHTGNFLLVYMHNRVYHNCPEMLSRCCWWF